MKLFAKASMMVAALLTTFSAIAADKYQEGTHYITLEEPVKVRLKKDEVAVVWEFFQYTCGHCFTLHAPFTAWKAKVPSDIRVEMMPVFRMDPYGKAFYAAEFLKLDGEFHDTVFNNIHVAKKPMNRMSDYADLAKLYGTTAEDFVKMAESFAVNTRVNQANEVAKVVNQALRDAGERFGTPSMMVNGKYIITGSMAGSNTNMMDVAEFLAQKEREKRLAN